MIPLLSLARLSKGFFGKQTLFGSSKRLGFEVWRSSLISFQRSLKEPLAFNQVPFLNKVVLLILKGVGIVWAGKPVRL